MRASARVHSSIKTTHSPFQYLEIARNLPSYGCLKFSNAIVDYPKPRTLANILIGNKELKIHSQLDDHHQESRFKVTRMRCWRVTTNYNVRLLSFDVVLDFTNWFARAHRLQQNDGSNEDASPESGHSRNSISNLSQNYRLMELSFEYLMAKNTLQWITISSEQSMLMSLCLQSIVDELLSQKDGNELSRFEVCDCVCHLGNGQSNFLCNFAQKAAQPKPVVLSYIRRDGRACNTTRISHPNRTSSTENNSVRFPKRFGPRNWNSLTFDSFPEWERRASAVGSSEKENERQNIDDRILPQRQGLRSKRGIRGNRWRRLIKFKHYILQLTG